MVTTFSRRTHMSRVQISILGTFLLRIVWVVKPIVLVVPMLSLVLLLGLVIFCMFLMFIRLAQLGQRGLKRPGCVKIVRPNATAVILWTWTSALRPVMERFCMMEMFISIVLIAFLDKLVIRPASPAPTTVSLAPLPPCV
eukprot:Lithocolla_globosa_v1_NODE_243_length_4898_cov_14.427008.p4 type:complete len:140 gc:universal NODE_243_length_4898_cov_14.427008:2740-2321(-)